MDVEYHDYEGYVIRIAFYDSLAEGSGMTKVVGTVRKSPPWPLDKILNVWGQPIFREATETMERRQAEAAKDTYESLKTQIARRI